MRVIGIVAEFNPFHQGHENLISRAREIVNDPRAIVMPVISESFVQRGLPAILPSDVRTKQALRCGADVVLGLPFTYSCAPSARFALGGIATLIATGVVTDIAFGYDAGTPELLRSLAEQTDENSPEFKEALKKALSEGNSYPAARAAAIKSTVHDIQGNIDEVLKSPNSILALEYLSALKKIDKQRRINIIMIPRDQSLESATSVREKMTGLAPSYSQAALFNALKGTMPDRSLAAMLASYSAGEFGFPDMAAYIRRALMHLSSALSGIGDCAYMGDDLDGYLKNLVSDLRPGDLPSDDHFLRSFAKAADTKRFTMTRIYRTIASFEAGQNKDLVKLDHPPYIRVLGFNREGRYCLKIIGKCTKLPVISNPSDALELCSSNEELKQVFELEMRASAIANDLYGRDISYAWTVKPVMT